MSEKRTSEASTVSFSERLANSQVPQLQMPVPLGRTWSDLSLIGHGLGRAFVTSQDVVLG